MRTAEEWESLETQLKLLSSKFYLYEHFCLSVTLFQLGQWDINYRNHMEPKDGIWMTFILKRKIMSEMMSTFLPSLLLLMITFATTFFKPFFFEAALTVNLTNMLVMTTIFVSVMEKLPLTSYPKMIDIWLIFCQLVPFSEVVLL